MSSKTNGGRVGRLPLGKTEVEERGFVCMSFCEQATEYYYSRETIILANPYCHGPMACAIQETETTQAQYSFSATVDRNVWKAFHVGITGGISKTTSTARAQTKTVNLKEGECGYCTFIPIFKVSRCVTSLEMSMHGIGSLMV